VFGAVDVIRARNLATTEIPLNMANTLSHGRRRLYQKVSYFSG
jgi:hypothetical protein